MDKIIEILVDKWPLAIWIIIAVVVTIVIVRLIDGVKKANEKTDGLKSQLEKLPCEKHKGIMDEQKTSQGNLDVKIDKLSNGMESIKKDLNVKIDSVKKDLDVKFDRLSNEIGFVNRNIRIIAEKVNADIINPSTLTQSMSPLSLTETGKQKAVELGIIDSINANWESISAYITEKSDSNNPYDLNRLCINDTDLFPEKFLSPDVIERIKIEAYKAGDIFSSYMRVVAVIVRDRYFEEKGILTSDIEEK